MDWNDYAYKQEQVKDYLRAAEQDRLARQLPRRTLLSIRSFDWRCFLSSRAAYLAAQMRHQWSRVRRASMGGPTPVLSDCR